MTQQTLNPSAPETLPGNNRRIGMVLDQPFPPDSRVEREAVALVEAGYTVHLLCLLGDSNLPREELYRGIFVHRVQPQEVSLTVPLFNVETRLPYRGVVKSLSHSFWNIDRAWSALIDQFVTRYQVEALHIHDLRLVSTGLEIAKKHHLPLVADFHENYPALMEEFKGKQDPTRRKRQRQKWERIETRCAQEADRIITVIEEAKDRLIGKGIAAEKIQVLPNTVDIEKFEKAPVDPAIIKELKSKFVLCYVGNINNTHRGIHTVLDAMALLKDEMPDLFFVGAGATRDHYLEALQYQIHQHGLSDRVHFTGWLDETDFVSYIKASDICLCPHEANAQTHATFPNKVYLYHLLGKPVIASSCRPLQRYVKASEGGVVFEAGNAQALAEAIRLLYPDQGLRRALGDRGRHAVLSTYNWQKSVPAFVAMYQELFATAAISL